MGKPNWWPGVSIRTRKGHDVCLSYNQGFELVRLVQARINELKEQMAAETVEYGHYSVHTRDRMLEMVDLLHFLKPGRDSRFSGSFMECFRRARGK